MKLAVAIGVGVCVLLLVLARGGPSAVPTPIEVRPEATIITASHAAFTVRQIMFAPIDEPALVILLDIDTTLPMTIVGSFISRPSPPKSAVKLFQTTPSNHARCHTTTNQISLSFSAIRK